MAARRAFPEHACAIGRPGHQCKARKRRRRNRRPLYHASRRALSIAFQVVSGCHEFNQQEGRARARGDLRKTRSKTCLMRLECMVRKLRKSSALESPNLVAAARAVEFEDKPWSSPLAAEIYTRRDRDRRRAERIAKRGRL